MGARDFVLSFNTKYNKIIGLRVEEKDGAFVMVAPDKIVFVVRRLVPLGTDLPPRAAHQQLAGRRGIASATPALLQLSNHPDARAMLDALPTDRRR